MIILGLLALIFAVVVGIGVWFNAMNTHTTDVAVFNYMLHGQTNVVVMLSILLGALGMLGLMMILGRASAIAGSRRATRRELREAHRETVAMRRERDRLEKENRGLAAQSAVGDEPPAYARRTHFWQRWSRRQPTHA